MKIGLIISFVFWISYGWGQTFTSSPGSAIASNATHTNNITVAGVGAIDCDNGLVEVCIDISHTWDSDLDIFLTDPMGTVYELTTDNGGSGNNYSVTCFNMSAGTNVTAGAAPFNGSYIPESDLAAVNNGQDADGVWTLEVTDDATGDNGTWNSWSLVFGATPNCPPMPTLEDCAGGTTICSDATFTGNSSGSGIVVDLDATNDGCLNGEHQTSWYYFQAATSGTYAFIIETAVDYDFAVWGPMADITCPPASLPLRCSYSGTLGNTGLRSGAGDVSEDASGDAIVDPIIAVADDIYIILIDNFTADGTSFNITWTLTGGATFDCSLLPIELKSFEGYRVGTTNIIEWSTSSEKNNAYFEIEKSTDGINWFYAQKVTGAGNSSVQIDYQYRDIFTQNGIAYYRLSQIDFDGKRKTLGTISIEGGKQKEVERIINLMGVEVDENYQGLKIYIYTDGSMAKIISE